MTRMIKPMAYEYKVIRRVEFSDTDMEGIMHFSNYFRFMETAEHAFFRSLGYSVVLSRNGLPVCLPRVHATCDYSAPLRFEDKVLVHLLVQKKGQRSLTYLFRFSRLNEQSATEIARGRLNEQSATEIARGRLTVVCAARQPDGTLKATPWPRMVSEQIQEAPPQLPTDEPRLTKPQAKEARGKPRIQPLRHRGRSLSPRSRKSIPRRRRPGPAVAP
jgi:acyl-CoA thioester hydrolase